MSDTLRGAALLIVGIAFLVIGINVLRLYKSSIARAPHQVLLWDVLSVLFTGPWSFPVGLAAIVMALGLLSAFFGGAVLITMLL